MSDLLKKTVSLLDRCSHVFTGFPQAAEIAEAKDRLHAPLRVAIAGRVKAGKSTLLNALVGDRLAPTDTGECTKVVTWYRNGSTYEVLLQPVGSAETKQVRFTRDDTSVDIDLDGHTPVDVERLVVTWPSPRLERLTLIDTPGVDTATSSLERKTFDFLDPQESDTSADAVLYLMKHIHSSDLSLLEAFHDDAACKPNPVNAVAVLSRSDEIAGGRVDAMASARKIAKRFGEERTLRRLVQLVVPVAGLLAETAVTLTEKEFGWLRKLSAVPVAELDPFLLSVDRFVEASPSTPLTSLERKELLERFGMYGLRQAFSLIRSGAVSGSSELSAELLERSGIVELRKVLATLFMDRSEVLKSRSALLFVERICFENKSVPGVSDILAEVEQVVSEAHPFNELSAIASLRSGWIKGKEETIRSLERILGGSGTSIFDRLALEEGSPQETVRSCLIEEISRWKRLVENPFVGQDLSTVIRVAIRSLEGFLSEV